MFPFDSKTFSDGSRLALNWYLSYHMSHGYTGTILPEFIIDSHDVVLIAIWQTPVCCVPAISLVSI